jgi:hypothetical protein
MFLFEKHFVLKLYKTRFLYCNLKGCAVLRRTPSVIHVKAKIKPITYVFVRKTFRTKRRFLSCNLKDWAVLRRTPSVVDVKAKIKPISYVFVQKTFRFQTFQNKIFIMQSERLCLISSNTISG